jgi:hypothetical protein
MKRILLSLTVIFAFANALKSQTQADTIFNYNSITPVTIDGAATEECWANAEWHPINQVWIPYGAVMKAGDFEGRFKVSWDSLYLYVLVEVVDDSLSDDHANPLDSWWDDDCLELFIDENRSKGDHQFNNNAFAYHVSLFYDAIDMNSSGGGVNYKNNIQVVMDTVAHNTYLWEFAVKNYSASFNINNPEASRVKLTPNKLMGFTIAYCDNDATLGRENFIGSMYMTAATANDNYITANYFGTMKLVAAKNLGIKQAGKNIPSATIYPVPATNTLTVNTNTVNGLISRAEIKTITGKVLKVLDFNESLFSINIDDMDKGIYILTLTNQDSVESQKFIKQ